MGTKQFEPCEPHTFLKPYFKSWFTTTGEALACDGNGPKRYRKHLLFFSIKVGITLVSLRSSRHPLAGLRPKEVRIRLCWSAFPKTDNCYRESFQSSKFSVCVAARRWCTKIWGSSCCKSVALRLQQRLCFMVWRSPAASGCKTRIFLRQRERERELLMCANTLQRNWVPGCRQRGGHIPPRRTRNPAALCLSGPELSAKMILLIAVLEILSGSAAVW